MMNTVRLNSLKEKEIVHKLRDIKERQTERHQGPADISVPEEEEEGPNKTPMQ